MLFASVRVMPVTMMMHGGNLRSIPPRIYAAMMTSEGVASVDTGLTIVVDTVVVCVADGWSYQSPGQRCKHKSKHKYLHFRTSIE